MTLTHDRTLTQTLPHLLFLSNPLTEQRVDAEDTAVEVGHDFTLHVARGQGKVKVSWGHKDAFKVIVVDKVEENIILPPWKSAEKKKKALDTLNIVFVFFCSMLFVNLPNIELFNQDLNT